MPPHRNRADEARSSARFLMLPALLRILRVLRLLGISRSLLGGLLGRRGGLRLRIRRLLGRGIRRLAIARGSRRCLGIHLLLEDAEGAVGQLGKKGQIGVLILGNPDEGDDYAD